MTKNEQVQEIIRVLCADYGNCEDCPFAVRFVDYYTCDKTEQANRIVLEKGYRKVERGEWEKRRTECLRISYYKCSVCGYEVHDLSNGETNFCPNCGADMRKEIEK